ncbi:glutathione S-transferase [Limoniibacter endophyticus]|uniref:Glutathione S-transferase n=1 Tax=Limoniibacter endophyticus TaxID=1565040 RepID=A0A8J3GJ48_9HYPH|nr:glutathione S-transferase [Limoniibacter endophyticus]GHC75806.1 glutathione S-transferase [Limoniibacter endophyticus]
MKLFDGGMAPNPRRVRIFLAEKGIEVPIVPVNMAAMEHRADDIAARNPLRALPVLELDDGVILTESVAICRYFEALYPDPSLFGTSALEQAQIEMWHRRIELKLLAHIQAAFRHLHPAMKEWEVPQVPEWGEINKPKAVDFMRFLDGELATRSYIAGENFSIADITTMIALDFTKPARIAIPDDFEHLRAYHARMKARPSSSA